MVKPMTFKRLLMSIAGLGLGLGCFINEAIAQGSLTTVQERPVISTEEEQRFVFSLVKTALIAVNQANLTGNYTVLQSLGNDTFLENNNSADLSLIFNNLRQSDVDFSMIVENTPIFTQVPTINDQNIIRTKGYFPTSPIIEFDILFQLVGDRYRIDSISVGVQPPN